MARRGSDGAQRRKTPRRAARGHAPGTAQPAYHHGDLRNALLAATDALLSEAGLEKFTLREVARRAGVSHGAPAHHFGDVSGLLSAYTAEGFAQLAAAMADRRAAASPPPLEQLIATGLAYVDYALAHRARFQLMFRSDRLDPESEQLEKAGAAAYGHLVDCVAALDPGDGPDADARRLRTTVLAWSVVHGYATLMLDNRHFAAHARGDRATALAMVEAMLRSMQTGFAPPSAPARAVGARGALSPSGRSA
jgi:AcrR family transcriptional regulator